MSARSRSTLFELVGALAAETRRGGKHASPANSLSATSGTRWLMFRGSKSTRTTEFYRTPREGEAQFVPLGAGRGDKFRCQRAV